MHLQKGVTVASKRNLKTIILVVLCLLSVTAMRLEAQTNTTTTLTSSLNPSTYQASVTFTATVSPSAASGTVTFKDGTTTLGTSALSSGEATFSIPTLAVGSHSITAAYGGDTNYSTSTSSTLTQTVSNGYSFRRTITIDHTQIPNSDQTNFPLLFSGTYSYLASTSNGGGVTNANGYDILLTSDANGANKLPFEQETYNPSTGAVAYWVQIPTLSHTTDTVIYLFYGNSAVSTDQSNKQAVWDASYAGVWHMSDDTSSPAVADSTLAANNGNAAANTNTKSVAGEIGNALSFANGTDKVTTPLKVTSAFTWEAWFYQQAGDTGYQSIMTIDGSNYALMDLHNENASFWTPDGLAGNTFSITGLSSNSWNHLVFVRSGDNSSNGYSAYLNGTLMGQASSGTLPIGNTITFGFRPDTPGQSWTGNLDEIRVSTMARSADWIAAEYNNQGAPWRFYDEGSPAITGLSENSGVYGDLVTITGRNFGFTQGASLVTFNGVSATVSSWSNNSIIATVPTGGTGKIVVTVNNLVSNGWNFQAIPTGWVSLDVGQVGKAGTASYSNGVFVIQGAGSFGSNTGNGTNGDTLHYVYQQLSGNGTIVARVTQQQAGTYPQIGLMMRETPDTESIAVMEYYQPNQSWIGYRLTTGGYSAFQTGSSEVNGQGYFWLKLVRNGNSFTGFMSMDGLDWVQSSSSVTISMANTICVGLAVTGAGMGTLGSGTFDSVSISSDILAPPTITSLSTTTGNVGSQVSVYGSGFGSVQGSGYVLLNGAPVTITSWSPSTVGITIPAGASSGLIEVVTGPNLDASNPVTFSVTTNPLPTGWLDTDVDDGVYIIGNASYSGGIFTVNGAGSGPTQPDSLHLAYRVMAGDGVLVARVTSFPISGNGGIVICGNHCPPMTSEFSLISIISTAPILVSIGERPPVDLTVMRTKVQVCHSGLRRLAVATFSAFIRRPMAPLGRNWDRVQTIVMAQTIYVGLYSAGGSYSLGATTFDNVSVTQGTMPVISSINPASGGIASSVTVNGSSFGYPQGTSTINFNGVPATTITSWSDSQIVAQVPNAATTGPLAVVVNSVGEQHQLDVHRLSTGRRPVSHLRPDRLVPP